MNAIRTVEVKHDTFPLDGGLDQVTPPLSMKPGAVRDAVNFELSETGGYARINGYEVIDGHSPLPSEATWRALTLTSVTGVAVSDAINATISGTNYTAQVIAISDLTLICTLFSGAVSWDGAAVYKGVTFIGTAASGGAGGFITTSTTNALYDSLASQVYHQIATTNNYQPQGSGPVRGVCYFKGDLYCWRNSSSYNNLRFKKWKQVFLTNTTTWGSVDLGYEMYFQNGNGTQPAEGTFVTQTNVSGTASAKIRRVILDSGTWAGGTAAGRFIVDTPTGTAGFFLAGTAAVTAASLTVILPTVSPALRVSTTFGTASIPINETLLPGGRVQWVIGTFNSSLGQRMYGCDGVNRAFEFDGTTYVPINTGMSSDAPTAVTIHKNFLFLAFGPSLQNSAIGNPYSWSPILGANEFLMPEAITALESLPGNLNTGALAVFTDNNTSILYGTGSSSWNLVPFNRGVGAKPYSVQTMDNCYYLDDRGVVSMNSSLNYGNFDAATLTFNVRDFVKARRSLLTASAVNQEKSQLRMFYSDGSALYMTIVNGVYKGAMPMQLPDPVFCWSPGETVNGTEICYVGSQNGWVYRLDSGNSFAGSNIYGYLLLAFNYQGSNRILKRYRRASLEVTGTGWSEYSFGYSLAYSSSDITQATTASYTIPLSPFTWDSFVWDSFTWDINTPSPREVICNGTGENISLGIYSDSNKSKSFKINSATIHYSPRRGIR